jgi:hypothetical protein
MALYALGCGMAHSFGIIRHAFPYRERSHVSSKRPCSVDIKVDLTLGIASSQNNYCSARGC